MTELNTAGMQATAEMKAKQDWQSKDASKSRDACKRSEADNSMDTINMKGDLSNMDNWHIMSNNNKTSRIRQ